MAQRQLIDFLADNRPWKNGLCNDFSVLCLEFFAIRSYIIVNMDFREK